MQLRFWMAVSVLLCVHPAFAADTTTTSGPRQGGHPEGLPAAPVEVRHPRIARRDASLRLLR